MSQAPEADAAATPAGDTPAGGLAAGDTSAGEMAAGEVAASVEVTVAVDATAVVTAYDLEMTRAWHWALLDLAGHLPDELLHQARAWLAAGRRLEVARAVAFAVLSGQLGVGGGEVPLIREELAATETDPDLLRALDALPLGERQLSAWVFLASDPALPGPPVSLPIDLTMTAGSRDGAGSGAGTAPGGRAADDMTAADAAFAVADGADGADAVDRAIVAAVAGEPDVLGVWRSWRLPAWETSWPPPRRVFVVTLEPLSDAAVAVTARLQEALVAAGEPDPRVEVHPAGVDAPAYQVLARVCGALLWARRSAGEVRVARVFDDVDPEGGPAFAVDRPRVDDLDQRDDLLAYLDAGLPVIGTTALMPDLLDPARGEVVPMTMRTDGQWIWTDTVSYYLEEHGLAPDPDLLRHIERSGLPPEPVDEVAQHRVLAHLLLQAVPVDDEAWAVPQTAAPARRVPGRGPADPS
ncbi:hypothetical protein [Frankia sp. R43]|uniref:hypothetical protein n=1 Tax=Frankia sp. R43 TaxID=269536 RepID=UPI00128F76E5|nr:hypothetical protein [Frankia sp. R43]